MSCLLLFSTPLNQILGHYSPAEKRLRALSDAICY